MKCCVPDCGYNHGRIRNPQSDITIHSFPKDPNQRAAWMDALAIPNLEPTCRMFICSQHFLEKDLQVTKNGLKRVRFGAVPFMNESKAPADSRVCKLCLTLDAKMYQLTNHKLSIMYRDIIGMPPNRGVSNKLPMGICVECASKLQTASAFRCKALICDTLLKEHYLTNRCLTVSDVQTLYKKHPDLKSKLAIKEVFKFDSNELTDLRLQPFVKIENTPEIEIEINNLDVKNESQNLNVNVKNEIDILDINDDNLECVDVDDDDNFDERSKIDFFENIVFVKSQNTQVGDTIELKSVESELNFENEKDADGNMDIVVLEDNTSAIEKKKTKKIVRSKVKKIVDEQPAKRGRKRKMPYVRPSIAIDENVFAITNLDPEELKKEILERQHCQRYILSPYKCTVCYKWFPTQDKLDRHAFKHSEKSGPLTCTICFVRLKSPRHMRQHMKHQHSDEFACKLCPLVTRNRNVARGHVKYHAGSKYPCQHCTMEFEKQTTYLNHLRLKHMSDCVCELCGYTFISKKGVTSHKQIKHRFSNDGDELKGPFCSVCDVKFLNKKAYDRHLRLSSKHVKSENDPNRLSNDPSIKSRRIGAQYARAVRRPVIRRRDTNQATDSGPFTCEQCGVVSLSYRMYAVHFKRSHPGINKTQFTMANIPYMCEQCGKMFNNATTLAGHMWVHTGQKRFQCDHCNKTFSMKANLAGHMKLHESVRKLYECNICGKQFSFNFNLTRHMFTHTGLRPFKCDACEKTFRTSGELRSHVDYVHLKKPRPKRVRRRNKKCEQPSLEY
uniref:Protein krueppel n=1 Tax=Heliothis virescens TaxID=7102 RepID=A0A2A4JTI5_HELVI